MCKWGNHRIVPVKVHPKDSYTGRSRWKLAKIDSCIAKIVRALQAGRVNMRGSCCGHNRYLPSIMLEDKSAILIVPDWFKMRDKMDEIMNLLEIPIRGDA